MATASAVNAQGLATKTQELRISYADLDISRPEGAATLLSRLKTASRQVCGGKPDMRDLERTAAFDRCYKAAVGDAVAAVHSAVLVALYDGTDVPAGKPMQSVAANSN
jgi:UrcA family protein